jgi:hypothetical protein
MKSKIICLPNGYFIRNRQLNLTPLMIDTLLVACEKQKEKVPFGPTDIKRSFMALVNRGLIIRETVAVHNNKEVQWQVTKLAISMPKNLGVIVAC